MTVRHERQQTIQHLLAGRGRLSVEELASRLAVTPMTIRRDLAAMEQAGRLTRTHGGCVLRSLFVEEQPFSDREQQHREQKLAIARAAVGLLHAGASVYLDTGTTAVHAARVLPPELPVRVFTNNLRAALELFGRSQVEVIVYGGQLAGKSPDLIGETAFARIRDFRIDVALIGADALDLERGELYAAEPGTASLSRAAQERADRCIWLVDSSKFGRRGQAVVGTLSSGVTLITDSSAGPAALEQLRATGATILTAT